MAQEGFQLPPKWGLDADIDRPEPPVGMDFDCSVPATVDDSNCDVEDNLNSTPTLGASSGSL